MFGRQKEIPLGVSHISFDRHRQGFADRRSYKYKSNTTIITTLTERIYRGFGSNQAKSG